MNISTIVYDEPTRRNRRLVVHLSRDISQLKANEQLLVRMLALPEGIGGRFRVDGISPVSPSLHRSSEFSHYPLRRKARAEIAGELSITLPRYEIICTVLTRSSGPTSGSKP